MRESAYFHETHFLQQRLGQKTDHEVMQVTCLSTRYGASQLVRVDRDTSGCTTGDGETA